MSIIIGAMQSKQAVFEAYANSRDPNQTVHSLLAYTRSTRYSKSNVLASDKRKYQVNIFPIPPQKHVGTH